MTNRSRMEKHREWWVRTMTGMDITLHSRLLSADGPDVSPGDVTWAAS